MDIYELMKQVNEWVKEILQDNYVGVYFHGSLRLGSFNPNKSDLDFIIEAKYPVITGFLSQSVGIMQK